MDHVTGMLAATLMIFAYVGLLVWASLAATRPLEMPEGDPTLEDYLKRAEEKTFRLYSKEEIDTTNPEFMEELDRIMSRDAGIPEIFIRKS